MHLFHCSTPTSRHLPLAHLSLPTPFRRRSTVHGGLESPVEMRRHAPLTLRTLNSLLQRLGAAGLIPPVWKRGGGVTPPAPALLGPAKLYGTEFLHIDRGKQEETCGKPISAGGWSSCAVGPARV